AQALDRQNWLLADQHGLGQVALSFIPPDRPGYAPDLALWPFNPTKARQTLAAAGHQNGKGIAPLTLVAPTGSGDAEPMRWAQGQLWANLGITSTVHTVDATAYNNLFNAQTTVPAMFYRGWCQDYPDPQNWLSLLFRSDSNFIGTGWANPTFDELSNSADA